ncbi:MAG: hypothetical protein V3T77_02810, partial [Planctomycetota bacterium]
YTAPDPEIPHLRWELPEEFPTGSRLRRIAVSGTFHDETSIRWRLDEIRGGGSIEYLGTGRIFSPLPPPADEPVRYVLSAWLLPSPDGNQVPLVEGIEVEWIPPPEPRES